MVIVGGVGLAIRHVVNRIPRSLLQLVVGVMLTTFGIFWGAEGAGVSWPGEDASLPGVLAFVLVVSLAYVTSLRRRRLALA